VLTAELRDDKGNLTCSASGPLSESLRGTSVKDENGRRSNKHWILAYSGTDGYFWNTACTDIKGKGR